MLSVEQQIADGRHVCPVTHQRLLSAAVRPLDRRISARNPSAHFMASSTCVYAVKA